MSGKVDTNGIWRGRLIHMAGQVDTYGGAG